MIIDKPDKFEEVLTVRQYMERHPEISQKFDEEFDKLNIDEDEEMQAIAAHLRSNGFETPWASEFEVRRDEAARQRLINKGEWDWE